jgi:uncharacterized membrane protein YhiD involved in acid resistance
MQEDTPDLVLTTGNVLNYSTADMLLNMLVATVLGFILTTVYRHTHKGLSYSQSFALTILFVTVIVAIVMMVIGSSLARAFALVGALSIIRFRTVVKDTKDTAFVFAGLALGMAAGTSNHTLAILATVFISVLALATHYFNYAALYKSEFILRFIARNDCKEDKYLPKIKQFSRAVQLLHLEPTGEEGTSKLTYDVHLKEQFKAAELINALNELEGISEIVLVAAKQDLDY